MLPSSRFFPRAASHCHNSHGLPAKAVVFPVVSDGFFRVSPYCRAEPRTGPQHMADVHIVTVDDEPDVRELIRDYLTGHGYAVSAAASGEELRRRIARIRAISSRWLNGLAI